MQHILYYIGLCLILPLLLLLFYLEKRARRIILSMMCGVIAGILSYIINSKLVSITNMDTIVYGYSLAPIVEETSKFIPILIIGLIVKKGKRGSAANAFSIGVGFGVCENIYYLFVNSATANVAWIIIRCVCTCLMHCMSSTIIGIGIYKARLSNKCKPLYVIVALLLAILFHGSYNLFVSKDILKYFGVFFPIILFFVFFFILKKQNIHDFLWDKESNNTKETNHE